MELKVKITLKIALSLLRKLHKISLPTQDSLTPRIKKSCVVLTTYEHAEKNIISFEAGELYLESKHLVTNIKTVN